MPVSCTKALWMISGFRRDVNENCALLGYCTASSGNFLPTFRDNSSFPSTGSKNPKSLKNPLEMGPIGCPETSVRNYHYLLHNNPVERNWPALGSYVTLIWLQTFIMSSVCRSVEFLSHKDNGNPIYVIPKRRWLHFPLYVPYGEYSARHVTFSMLIEAVFTVKEYDIFFTRSPFVTLLSRRAQSGRSSSYGKLVWFTESNIVFVIIFYLLFYLLSLFLI